MYLDVSNIDTTVVEIEDPLSSVMSFVEKSIGDSELQIYAQLSFSILGASVLDFLKPILKEVCSAFQR